MIADFLNKPNCCINLKNLLPFIRASGNSAYSSSVMAAKQLLPSAQCFLRPLTEQKMCYSVWLTVFSFITVVFILFLPAGLCLWLALVSRGRPANCPQSHTLASDTQRVNFRLAAESQKNTTSCHPKQNRQCFKSPHHQSRCGNLAVGGIVNGWTSFFHP